MGTTPHTIVDTTRAALVAATLPGTPTMYPWRLLPFGEQEAASVAIVANAASDQPASVAIGPARWTRIATLTLVAWVAPTSTDAALGAAAATLQEAILDALFGSQTWCDLWESVPRVDCTIDPDRTSDARRCAVVISIRGQHSVSRDLDAPESVADLVHITSTVEATDPDAVVEGETPTEEE
jgi:hypothetical protein